MNPVDVRRVARWIWTAGDERVERIDHLVQPCEVRRALSADGSQRLGIPCHSAALLSFEPQLPASSVEAPAQRPCRRFSAAGKRGALLADGSLARWFSSWGQLPVAVVSRPIATPSSSPVHDPINGAEAAQAFEARRRRHLDQPLAKLRAASTSCSPRTSATIAEDGSRHWSPVRYRPGTT
jgi:hypothetical protein